MNFTERELQLIAQALIDLGNSQVDSDIDDEDRTIDECDNLADRINRYLEDYGHTL